MTFRNKIVTSITKATSAQGKRSLVMGLVLSSLVLSALVPQEAHATHLYSGNHWGSSTVNLCYDSFSLSQLNIGSTAAKSQLDIARADWNTQGSRWNLNLIDPNQYCFNWVYAVNYGQNGVLAQAPILGQSGNTITKMELDFNYAYSFTTSSSCSSPYTMNYVAKHELGHWVNMIHPSSSTDVTVLHTPYDCNYNNSVKPNDGSTVKSVYG